MFETNDEGKLPLRSNRGEHLWSYVRPRLQNPWIHLQYSVADDAGDFCSRTLHLSDVSQLLEISQREDVRIEYVDLVSPEWINGSDRWKMEPLKQIWRREGKEGSSSQGYVFVLDTGVRYIYQNYLPENSLCNEHLLFHLVAADKGSLSQSKRSE